VGKEAVNACDADVVEMLDLIAHKLGGGDGFFGDGNVAGAGGHDEDGSFAIAAAIAVKGDGSGERAIFSLGNLGSNSVVLLFGGAGGEDVGAFVVGSEVGEYLGNLSGRFAFAEDDFGHALAKRAVVIEFGEAEVFEGQMTKALDGLIGRELSGPDFVEQLSESVRVHDEGTL